MANNRLRRRTLLAAATLAMALSSANAADRDSNNGKHGGEHHEHNASATSSSPTSQNTQTQPTQTQTTQTQATQTQSAQTQAASSAPSAATEVSTGSSPASTNGLVPGVHVNGLDNGLASNQSNGHKHTAAAEHHHKTVALTTTAVTTLKTQLAATTTKSQSDAPDSTANDTVVVTAPVVATLTAATGALVNSPTASSSHHGTGGFEPNEIVAVNMNEVALANAKALGFVVRYDSGDGDALLPITRLQVPPGTDTQAAARVLRIALPGQIVALNSLYHIYEGASGGPDVADNSAKPPNCTGETCKPWSVIGWKSFLRGCSSGVKIGMIDTGVDTRHPALAGVASVERIVARKFHRPNVKATSSAHGTAIASLLVGDEEHGIAGLVPDATLYAADAFYADGDQSVTDSVSLLKALDWLHRRGVKVVNMSFAGPDDPLLELAISRAVRDGMIIVSAAGNAGADAPEAFPAAYPDVIAVTAVTNDLKPYVRANHGEYIDLAAPGVHIWTAGANGKGGYESGTSFAAPYVTAMAATVWKSAGSKPTRDDILARIPVKPLSTQDHDPVFGRGLARAPDISPAVCEAARFAKDLPWMAADNSAAPAPEATAANEQ